MRKSERLKKLIRKVKKTSELFFISKITAIFVLEKNNN